MLANARRGLAELSHQNLKDSDLQTETAGRMAVQREEFSAATLRIPSGRI